MQEGPPAQPMRGVWAKGGPVFSHLPEAAVLEVEGKAIASFGDAAALGFWSTATGLCVTGLFQADVLAVSAKQLFPSLLVYSGILPFVAGLFLYRRNNTFLASTFCSFGALDLTRGSLLLALAGGLLSQNTADNLLQGYFMEAFAYVSLSLFFGSLRINVIASLMTGLAGLGYLSAGLKMLMGWLLAGQIGGALLLAAGIAAFYGGTAVLVNTAWHRAVLPIGGQA